MAWVESPKAQVVRIGPEHLLASCSIPYIHLSGNVGGGESVLGWRGDGQHAAERGHRGRGDEIIVVLLAPMPGQAGGWPLPRHPFQIIPLVLDLALLATFENDYRQLEAVNRAVRQGRPLKPSHREIRCHVIAPARPLPLSRILRYDLQGTQALMAQGEADAQRALREGIGAG